MLPFLDLSRAGLHPKKIMLSVWWDIKGVIHYELLDNNQTINANLYCEQLRRLKTVLSQKRASLVNRKSVIFHHDNARPHTTRLTKTLLEELGWEILLHPPYSPDLAPSDYHLFRGLQNHFDGLMLTTREEIENALDSYFGSKPTEFYK
ncbi:histone-lysine N-methyltransferase SETMAR-like [Octopus bimaculoides]|uniref:histone-lysine N-methyltransferase SETMAR-like n=1 Tax=Octopus bimaculoides TaxID=37653 RepID=UPI00071E2B0F|nr:histone-lysine N-methyltransferase SETMAR-like [Octopus bimaculoides]|eukprot:XP_014785013.1 PREDICTED: histone-lysine N-methyltransferase SETMAR-like [Octopus bimaculoides]